MQIRQRDLSQEQALDKQLDSLLDRVLRQRGITDVSQLSMKAKDLLHYRHLKGIQAASDLIADAIVRQQKICIVGDFDADGATSTALCILALRQMGHRQIEYIVPNRFDFGYGLTPPVVDIAQQRNCEVLITVDNGISSFEGVAYAKKLGMRVVITDHHLPAEALPEADAIVNPNQPGCEFPSKHIAGVGVAFYLMSAVKNTLLSSGYFEKNSFHPPNLAEFLDIVAIGTVADVVSLDLNNRILVQQGIQRMRTGRTRPGVLAIFDIANKDIKKCCSSDIGFVIGPRLNAAGRLEDMSVGIECLLTDSLEEATKIAHSLDSLNQSRKDIQQQMQAQAQSIIQSLTLKKDSPSGLVVYRDDFHQGVVGVVAGRLKEQYHLPTIVFANETDEIIKGSCRSVKGVHIRDVLARIDTLRPGLIIKFGGHAMAAGLSLKKSDLNEFTEMFNELIEELADNIKQHAIVYSDGSLSVEQMCIEMAAKLKYSYPWGQGFEEPMFDGEFELVDHRIVGQKHLKMILKHQQCLVDAICFNIDLDEWPCRDTSRVKIAFRLDVNEFRGQSSVQFIVASLSKLTCQA